MDTKLTLKLDENIIAEAKLYAKSKQISLSVLIENYLKKLTTEKKSEEEITPLVKSLSGVIDLPDDFNARNSYTNHLIKKYK